MSSVSFVSQATMALWAKSDRGKDAGRWHPLMCHLLDVAASCLEILELEPPSSIALLSSDFGVPSDQAVAITAALVGLHDIGKANPEFQIKSEACAERVRQAGFRLYGPERAAHGIVSEAILVPLLQTRDFSAKSARLVADAVGAHHGFRSQRQVRRAAFNHQGDLSALWLNSQRELFDLVWQTLGAPSTLPLKDFSAAAFQRLMGLTCVADWIGSSLDFADFPGDPKTYLEGARQRARVRLQQVGWSQRRPLTAKNRFEEIFPFAPRPLQAAVATLVAEVREPVLLLVEAPMGEGKTEASFFAHVALQQQLEHRGAYVGLPSQATGNAMFERLRAFLSNLERAQPPDLQLLHGAAILSDSYQELQNYSANTDADQVEAVTARSYFTHLKRALLSEYGAGTIDQALLSVLPVKHYFVRLWGLGNRTVILDEVHAYDTYTGELLAELVAWLKALGSSVILMSATLPAHTRQKMLEAFGAAPGEAPVAYPRVTRVHAGAVTSLTFETRPLARFRVKGAPVAINALASTVLSAAQNEGCIACIMNTVDRAQKLYRALQAADPSLNLQLFHARFPIQDKLEIEERVLDLYGKGDTESRNPQRPQRSVLVATQVVEQSLDLDFDLMFTDLAPVDLVLQRAGRLHRHDKNKGHRGPHEVPNLLVCGLDSTNLLNDWRETAWEVIYAPHILVRTWLALKREVVDLNSDLDPLVQTVYDTSLPLVGQAAFSDYLDLAEETNRTESRKDEVSARMANIGNPTGTEWKIPSDERLSDDECKVVLATRKVEPTVTVVPVYVQGEVCSLDPQGTLPLKRQKKLKTSDAVTIYQRTVKISRKSLVPILKKWERPWPDSPLLKDCIPLYLRDGQCVVGRTLIQLSHELGLVYIDQEKS